MICYNNYIGDIMFKFKRENEFLKQKIKEYEEHEKTFGKAFGFNLDNAQIMSLNKELECLRNDSDWRTTKRLNEEIKKHKERIEQKDNKIKELKNLLKKKNDVYFKMLTETLDTIGDENYVRK